MAFGSNKLEEEPDFAQEGVPASLSAIQQEGKKRARAWRMVFIVAIILLVVSLVALGVIAFSYFQGQQKYGKLADNVEAADVTGPLEEYAVDWNALREVNPDVVAWVFVPGTNINYPVVRGADNEYYLTHDFENEQGWLANYGAIFMDYRNAPNWRDDAYFMYGHHMNDGSMFADIANMEDQGRFDASRTVYLFSPIGNFKLRSFSLVHCSPDDPLVQITFTDKAQLAKYVQDIMNRSVVNAGSLPAAADIQKVFAFSTCDNFSSGRFVLFAYIEQTTVEVLSDEESADGVSDASRSVHDVLVDEEAAVDGDGTSTDGVQEPVSEQVPAEESVEEEAWLAEEDVGESTDEYYDESYDGSYDEAYEESYDEAYEE